METENPIGPSHRGGQRGLNQALEIYGKIETLGAQLAPVSHPGARVTPLEDGDTVHIGILFE